MVPSFEYQPLDRGHIRLFQLLGCDQEIRGRIHVVSLDSHPEYQALSYVWGDPKPSQRVSVDGFALYIAENLATALLHLREFINTYVWIDAICINQSDTQEKGYQVSQMPQVYRQATQVLAWLGPDAEESDLAMDGLNRYGKEAFEAGVLEISWSNMRTWPEVDDDPHLVGIRSNLLRLMGRATKAEDDDPAVAFPSIPFARLTHRGYFERAWVKQELILAADPLIICGAKTVPQPYFYAGILFYGLWYLWKVSERRAGRLFGTRLPEQQAIEKLQLQVTSEAPGRLFAGRRTFYERKSASPLMEHLNKSYIHGGSSGLKCQDPRDKIYALLGISGDVGKLGLYPDYSQGPEVLYEKVARALITQGHIDILRFCRSQERELPSWVPDWSASIRYSWSDEGLFNASQTAPPTAGSDTSFGNISGVLQMRGTRVDTILKCGSVWTAGITVPFDGAAAKILFAEVETFLGEARYTPGERAEALWRVPIGDKETHALSAQWQRATPTSQEQHRVLAAAKPTPDHLKAIYPFPTMLTPEQVRDTYSYQTIMRNMYDARPFLSAKGYVGLCPKESVAGDVVCIFVGGQVPYVLRPKGKDGHTLVGEAYVHGIMDGQFLEINGDARMETFDLY